MLFGGGRESVAWIAIYGACLSTIVFAWNVYSFIRDRPRLSVRCRLAVVTGRFIPPKAGWNVAVDGEVDFQDDNPFVAYRILNSGASDIVVERVGGAYAHGKTFSARYEPIQLPKRLIPGDYFEFAVPPNVISDDLKFLAAWDSKSKIWKAPGKETKRIKKAIRAQQLEQ